jgi:hypothetical protein
MLFRQDFDGSEVLGQSRALELASLLFGVAFGDHDEAVTSGEIGESWGDVRKEFDLLVGDGLGEALDAAVFLGCERDVGELLETGDKRAAKAMETVAVGMDGGVLDAVEVVTDFFGSVDAMIEVGDEAGDGPLEVDVVFPEGVVCVDEQRLVDRISGQVGFGGHATIISLAD